MEPLKDVAYVLRSAYKAKLILSFDGEVVPVYDTFVPANAPKYFVVMTDQHSADDSLKCGHSGDVHSVFDVVTKFKNGEGSSMVSDSISGQIKSLLVPNTIDLHPDWNIMSTVSVIDKRLVEETNTYRIVRKILTFKNIIQQLN